MIDNYQEVREFGAKLTGLHDEYVALQSVLSDAMGRPVGGKGEMGVLDAIRQLHRERLELEVALKNARAASPRRWPATRDQAILASMVNAIVEADRPGAMAEEFAADRQDGVVSGRLAGRQVSFHAAELRNMQFAEARAFVLKRIDGTQQPQETDHERKGSDGDRSRR